MNPAALLSDRWMLAFAIVFAVVNAYLVSQGQYLLLAIPFGLLAAALVFMETKTLLLGISMLTPLSFNLEGLDAFGGIGFYFPTEPLLFGLMVVFFIWAIGRNDYDQRIIRDPFSLVVIAGLIWIFFTCLTSSMPMVSFKFLLSRLWFVIPLYFLAVYYFKERGYLNTFLWLHVLALGFAISHTVVEHASYGFSEKTGHYVMWPFYKDHTSYGAVIAMFMPLVIGRAFTKGATNWQRTLYVALLVIYSVGLVLSYTRAAWLSLVIALAVYIIMQLRIKFWTVFAIGASLIIGFFVFQDDIIRELERNSQDSSDSFAEHIQSMTNVSTDASNLERLNRWNSAIEMFKERPLMGWGPGTYMFQYAPFQKSSELTIISTNLGTGGNAHSEYLGPLAEQGVLGTLAFVLLMIFILNKGIVLYFRLEDRELRMLVMSMTLGLITYFAHGVLNNYLDTDKASVPFWGFCAGIVAIDLYHRKRADSKAMSS